MYRRCQWLETLVRLSFVFIFFTTTLIPSSASATSLTYQVGEWWETIKDKLIQEVDRPILKEHTLGKYSSQFQSKDPPNDPPNDPHPKPNLPKKESDQPLSFILDASPGLVGRFGKVTLTATIINNSPEPTDNLSFIDTLEKEFTYISSESKLVTYDEKNNQVEANIGSIDPGEEVKISYSLQVESKKKAENPNGNIVIHVAEIKSPKHHLKTKVDLWLDYSSMNVDYKVGNVGAGGGWVEADQVSMYFAPLVLEQDFLIASRPIKVPGGPQKQFKIEMYKTESVQTGSDGKFQEQRVKVLEKDNEIFDKPVYMEIDFQGITDLKNIPPGKEPFVVTYNQELENWVKVPILAIEHEKNKVFVEVKHFSIWGTGLGDSLPQNGANVLLFDQPYTYLFTGAARYSIPIWMPTGRAGMAPDVLLSYSSSTANGVLGDIQAPWVGMGWNIDGIEIVRKITTDGNGYGYENEFALTYNGTAYELIPDLEDFSRYYTKESSFLYIERHNTALGNDDGVSNAAGEWWEVVATDGTRYRLGWNTDSEQLTLMEGYVCNEGNPCVTPEDAYAFSGFAGNAQDLIPFRWRVDLITDTHGNFIEYSYHEEHIDSNPPNAAFDHASYLETISYTGYTGGGGNLNPGYQIVFKRRDRDPLQIPSNYSYWDHYDNQHLSQIEIYRCDDVGGCDGYAIDPSYPDTLVRTYELEYSMISDGWDSPQNYTLLLSSIKETGGNFSEGQVSIPSTESPTILFTYQNFDNIVVEDPEADNVFRYPRLISIENGFGGELNYYYLHDGRDHTSWLNYRVDHVEVDSGFGVAAYEGYAYQNPEYEVSNGTGALIGYQYVTEVKYNFEPDDQTLHMVLRVKHEFGTEDLDIGNEFTTMWLDPSNNDRIMRKAIYTYATDNSLAPSENWNFHYLYSTTNFERKGNVLSQINKTTNLRHPGNGNLVVQSDYLASTLYRKKYFEYLINNDPEVYILDRVSRELLTDENDIIISETVNEYDGGSLLSLGELTLSQSKTGTSNQSVDTKYYYDDYGNIIETRSFSGYGAIGANPGVYYQSISTIYDNTLKTYPVTITNELNQSKTTDYLSTLGLPYQVTDASNIITATEYDGLGRVLTVSVPMYNQVGADGIRYTYPVPNAQGVVGSPYSIEMEILDTHPSPNVYRSVWGIYDGLGRIIQNQVENSDNNKILISNYRFNAQGQIDRESIPLEETTNGGTYQSFLWSELDYSTTEYDLFGRVIKNTPAAGEDYATETAYDGLTTSVIDAEGHRINQTVDGLGRLVKVKEYSGSGSQNHSLYATTVYSYDVADRLTKVVDAQSNQTSIIYDALGRKLQMVDPDMGTWDYKYDPLGNLTQQIDARNESVCFYYDGINRLSGKYYHDQTACPPSPTLDVSFTYDDVTDGNLGVGKRTGMVDEAGSTAWFYEDSGRKVTETRTINATNYAFETSSDWMGRVEKIKYPDNEEVTYNYDALGRVDNLEDGASNTLANLAYNVLGQITQIDFGNNAQVSNAYDFTDDTFRLTDRIVDYSSTEYINFEYFYDDVGNVTQINDNKLDEILTYDYDDLNRLTSAEAFVGTDYSYRQQFEYDKVGNILKIREWDEDIIFKDDYENGDFSAWSSNSNDSGDLAVSSNYVYIGDYALEAIIDDTNSIYVQDDSPDSETRYRTRFYIDTNGMTMADGDVFTIFADGNADSPLVIELGYTISNGYQIRTGIIDDSSSYSYSSWYPIDDNWHAIEIDWNAATGVGLNDGFLILWIDGSEKETVSNVDNDTKRVSQIRIGVVDGLDVGASGTIYFDAFESRSITYIGELPDSNPLSMNVNPLKVAQDTGNINKNNQLVEQDSQVIPIPTGTPTPEEIILVDSAKSNNKTESSIVYVNHDVPSSSNYSSVNNHSQTVIGEVGRITDLNQNLQTIILSHSFSEPVVFIGPLSFNESDPAVVRVTNVQSDRFSLYIQDATNVDGDHIYETVSYLVLEAGSWVVNGKKLEVGKINTNAAIGQGIISDSWETISLTAGFPSTPAVISQIQTDNDPTFAYARENSLTTNTFSLTMDQLGNEKDHHGSEWIGWAAMETGTGTWDGHKYEAGNDWYLSHAQHLDEDFSNSYFTPPNLFGAVGSYNDQEYVSIRWRNITESQVVDTFVLEDTTVDDDITHGNEIFTHIVIEGTGELTGEGTIATFTPTATSTDTHTPTNTPLVTATPTSTSTSTNTPTSTSAPQILAQWHFDEGSGSTTVDSSGHNRTGRVGYAEWATGVNGYGIRFTTNVSRVTVSNGDIRPSGDFTIDAWIKPTYINNSDNYIISRIDHLDYVLALDSQGRIKFYLADLTPNVVIGPEIPLNEWTNVAGVYDKDNGRIKVYVNGILAASAGVSGNITYGRKNVLIGKNITPDYRGIIDELTIYNRALTDAELLARYNTVWNLYLSAHPPTQTATPVTPTLPPNTPTIMPTPNEAERKWGTGDDGDLTVASGTTFNLHTDNSNGRSCANGGDGVIYPVDELTGYSATLNYSVANGCLAPGDEIMLINLQGTSANHANVGHYEFLRVHWVDGSKVYFTTAKTKWYGKGIGNDVNIGTNEGEQHVVLMRVPNYEGISLEGTLTGNAWDNSSFRYGFIAFRVSGTLSGAGMIDMSVKGFDGGRRKDSENNPNQGDSYTGIGVNSAGPNGGGGGAGGAGGANGQAGENGGGYDTQDDNRGRGGFQYGDLEMNTLYMGSGGGGGGVYGSVTTSAPGGKGAGIIFLAANTITFSGNIQAIGEDTIDKPCEGGAGAGGSIRIEADNINPISTLTINAEGGNAPKTTSQSLMGGDGGDGRISIYYDTTFNSQNVSFLSLPFLNDVMATPTPTPTATPALHDTHWGTGSDGDAVIGNGETVNIGEVNIDPNKSCGDGGDSVSYSVTSLNSTSAQVYPTPEEGCLAIGNEIMLINVRGDGSHSVNVGNYEFLRIGNIEGNTIIFKVNKKLNYGENANNDSNIGIEEGQQRVVIVRVPNYNSLTVEGTLTTNVWDGKTGGILPIRVKESLVVSGQITVSDLGYFADGGSSTRLSGESYPGEGKTSIYRNAGGGGRGDNDGRYGGAGGGHRTPGQYNGDGVGLSEGGSIYGQPSLDTIFFGSSGGDTRHAKGGRGGGILWITAKSINVTGNLTSDGADTPQVNIESGGGAGGSIYMFGNGVILAANSISTAGGLAPHLSSGTYKGGNGGEGRSAVFYLDEVNSTINASPDYLNGSATVDLIFSDEFESGDLSAWDSAETDSGDLAASSSANQWGDYGMAASIDDTSNLYVQDDSPDAEDRYFGRFYTNLEGLSMSAGDSLDLINGSSSTENIFTLQLLKTFDRLWTRVGAYEDSSSWEYGNWYSQNSGISSDYLVSYWKLEVDGGTRVDSAGNNDLTDATGTHNADGVVGHGAYFSGDYFTAASNSDLQLGDVDFHYGMWVNNYSFDTDTHLSLIHKGEEIFLKINKYKSLILEVGGCQISHTPGFELDKWYYIEAWHDATNDRIGIAVNRDEHTSSCTETLTVGTDDLHIGAQAGVGRLFKGTMDELSFFKGTKLTQEQRDILYNAGKGNTYNTDLPNSWNGLGIEWQNASDPTSNDGYLSIFINGNNKETISNLENGSQTVDSVRLGAMDIDSGISGTIYYDNFESRRFTMPETLEDPGAPDPDPTAQPSWLDATYNYDGGQAHAVTSVVRDQSGGGDTTDSYQYDSNGNMTCRYEGGTLYLYSYNAENRLEKIEEYDGSVCGNPGALQQHWEFTYDGDGNRVKEEHIIGGQTQYTRHFLGGGLYEFEDDGVDVTSRKYYSIGGEMVAMREWINQGNATTYYLASDHLSSTSIVMDSSGSLLSENRYMPFGETRTISGLTNITETDFGYTGQRDYGGAFSLMDYKARFYSPSIGRFTQPDSIMPEPGNPQAWNRYSYVENNPIVFNDPTGHMVDSSGSYNPWKKTVRDKGILYDLENDTYTMKVSATSIGVGEVSVTRPWLKDKDKSNDKPNYAPIYNPPLSDFDPENGGQDTEYYEGPFLPGLPLYEEGTLPDILMPTVEFTYSGGIEPFLALGIDCFGMFVDGASVISFVSGVGIPPAIAMEASASGAEIIWTLYQASKGSYIESAYSQAKFYTDVVATFPLGGFYGSLAGVGYDFVDIINGFDVVPIE